MLSFICNYRLCVHNDPGDYNKVFSDMTDHRRHSCPGKLSLERGRGECYFLVTGNNKDPLKWANNIKMTPILFNSLMITRSG